MSNELLLYIAFILLLAVFGAIFWLREKQINAKFSKFELAIEGLIKENYQLKKQIKDNAKPQEIIKNDIDMDEINHMIELKINEGLIQKISPILQNVHIIEQAVNVSARLPNTRKIQHISTEELSSAMITILKTCVGTTREAL